MIRFTVPFKVTGEYGMNAIYSGIHWAKRSKQAKEIHELMYWSMIGQKVPKKLFKRPVAIRYSFNSNLDIDNHGYISKMLTDGLKGYLIQDDKRKYVKEIRQRFYDKKGIMVEIWEVEDETNN